MVWRISAGVGPLPGAGLGAAEVRRRGGLSRSCGAMLACLTRRGSPFTSPSPSGCAPGLPSPGIAGCGPLWRDSSHGGAEDRGGRGEATGVIGTTGPAAPPGPAAAPGPAAPPGRPATGAEGVTEPPATLRPVHPGNGVGWSPKGAAPAPGYGAAPAPGYGAVTANVGELT